MSTRLGSILRGIWTKMNDQRQQAYGVQGMPISLTTAPAPEGEPSSIEPERPEKVPTILSAEPTLPVAADRAATPTAALATERDSRVLAQYRALVDEWERVAETTPIHTAEARGTVNALFQCIADFRAIDESGA